MLRKSRTFEKKNKVMSNKRKHVEHEVLPEGNWSTVIVGQDAKVIVMPVDGKVQERMPSTYKTFAERGMIELIIKAMNDYIEDRSRKINVTQSEKRE